MCKLIGEGSPRYLNTFSNLFIVAVHYTQCIAIAYCTMYTMLSTENNQNIPYLVAIADCTNFRSAAASFEDLVALYRRTLRQIFWFRISYSLLWI